MEIANNLRTILESQQLNINYSKLLNSGIIYLSSGRVLRSLLQESHNSILVLSCPLSVPSEEITAKLAELSSAFADRISVAYMRTTASESSSQYSITFYLGSRIISDEGQTEDPVFDVDETGRLVWTDGMDVANIWSTVEAIIEEHRLASGNILSVCVRARAMLADAVIYLRFVRTDRFLFWKNSE